MTVCFFNKKQINIFDLWENLESYKYYQKVLREKYGNDFKNIILTKYAQRPTRTYQYYFVTRGITKEDILTFIGIKIYMGLHKYPNLKSYWTKNSLNKVNFNRTMPKNYYFLLATALHFPETEEKEETDSSMADSSKLQNDPKQDPRHKINLYLEKLAKNFQKYYTLGDNITIDESLIHFKGRNSMKFYIPMKPHKYGFKIHLLCDSDTHYLYNMLFDPGRSGKNFIWSEDSASLAESIVLKLLSAVTDKTRRRNVFFDGWYSSINLMKKLTKLGFLNTTVLRANSKELPTKIKKEGYDKALNEEILIQKYEGKKTIYFATNYKIDIEELRNIYNIKNRGVDTFDQYLEISSIQRRTLKWYKKIFLFGIDCSIINSKILFELRTGKQTTTVKFKEALIEQIFALNSNNKRRYHEDNIFKCISKDEDNLANFYHDIRHVDKEGICKHCGRASDYICFECNVPLHFDCFPIFHNY